MHYILKLHDEKFPIPFWVINVNIDRNNLHIRPNFALCRDTPSCCSTHDEFKFKEQVGQRHNEYNVPYPRLGAILVEGDGVK